MRGELIGFQDKLDTSSQRTFLCDAVRDLSPAYAAAEVLWYFGGSGAVAALETYAPSYRKFDQGDGTAYGAYGPRIMRHFGGCTALSLVVDVLRDSPNSRQAVLSLWDPIDILTVKAASSNDIPCTLSWQFLLRDGSLHMVVTMRSNDIWLGMPYDVFAFTCFQRIVAAELGCDVGTYTHQAGSLHLYERNAEKASLALFSGEALRVHGWAELDDTIETMQAAVRCEEKLRRGESLQSDQDLNKLGWMGRDLVAACAHGLQGPDSTFPRPFSRSLNRCRTL